VILITTPLERIPKISRRILPALRRLGIKTVRDLLFHFPSRYDNFSNLKSVREVKVGETVTLRGKIVKIANRRTARKHMLLTEAVINDGTGIIKAVWFNQPYLLRNLKAGAIFSFSGKAALGPDGMYLQNPAYEKIQNPKFKIQNSQGIHTGGWVAIYPETRGITSRWLRYLINQFIELCKELSDPLPYETRRKYQLPEIKEALRMIHFPKSLEEAEKARRRFNFEGLLLIQLRAMRERLKLKECPAPEIPVQIKIMRDFVASLPFSLTDAQRKAIWEILQDISRPRPMNRLLEGDVGSGKTVVAAAAALLTTKAGFKTVFMAPTEILARQHYDTISKLLKPFDIRTGLLIGAEKKIEKDSEVIIGTHALLEEGRAFEKLGLVVIDEQHRFGVEQRARLIKNNAGRFLPHFLSMSATPIPRTLALTIYGDLDLSILDEMPKNRKPVITKIVEPGKREEAYQFIREEVKKGRQAFVICPRIETDDPNSDFKFQNSKLYQQRLLSAEVKSVKEEYEKLSKHIFPDLKVKMLHGRMKSGEKDAIMKKFKTGDIDILVSTSVVEVGVDVPRATVMMIEGAERFGLAQLHQFRGRVGRGEEQAYCFLFPSEDGMITRRLRAVAEAKTGFELAEKDLEIRGAGDIFGTRQWGLENEMLRAVTDAKLVREVRHEAAELLQKDPSLDSYPLLKNRLEEMEKTIHLE